jgi:hypothetical protein
VSCAGVTLRGYRRGEPCGTPGQYAYRGKMYCAQHRTIAAASPGEFKLAQAALFKRLGKEAYKAMQAKAQLDAFDSQSSGEAKS